MATGALSHLMGPIPRACRPIKEVSFGEQSKSVDFTLSPHALSISQRCLYSNCTSSPLCVHRWLSSFGQWPLRAVEMPALYRTLTWRTLGRLFQSPEHSFCFGKWYNRRSLVTGKDGSTELYQSAEGESIVPTSAL